MNSRQAWLVVIRGENICEAAQKGNVAAVRHFLRTDLSTLHLENGAAEVSVWHWMILDAFALAFVEV